MCYKSGRFSHAMRGRLFGLCLLAIPGMKGALRVLKPLLNEVGERALRGDPRLTGDEALFLFTARGSDLFELLSIAGRLRAYHKGDAVALCAIINAKSGRCPEDCAFCAQSVHFNTGINQYPLLKPERILDGALRAQGDGAREFSIVTSGRGIRREKELEKLCRAVELLTEKTELEPCASLGILGEGEMRCLREAGLYRLHHNLETARSFFSRICTTHDYEEDVASVRAAKELGFRVCSGGIFGMGEGPEERVELALTLRELQVDSIPLNFLNPIPGTPLEGRRELTPLECLKIIAIYRLFLPDRDIFVCGGREVNLRQLQPLIFPAGANGTLIGNYLTTPGRPPEEDVQMIEDLGLEVGAAKKVLTLGKNSLD